MPIALILAATTQAASPPPTATVPPQPALTQAIAARDAEFFDLFFQGCDPDRLATMLADDVEMYHDKGGFVFRSAAQMVADYSKSCEERKRPDAWRSRRELVPASLRVHPVPGHGAIEEGEHLFYERKGDGPEKRVGRARFAQLWVLSPGGWRLSRIFSFDHGPAD
jgi:hypothetical protein